MGVMKLRDDTIAIEPLNASSFGNSVQVKRCSSYKGFNDKVMIVPREYLFGAFEGILEIARKVENGDQEMVKKVQKCCSTPERMLHLALYKHGCPVSEVSPAVLPLVDGRCVGKGTGARSHCPTCP